jgi:PAS domain S-box-containing protein
MAINKLLKTIQKNAEERDNFFRTIQKNNDKLGRTLDAFSDGHWEYDLEKDTWFFSAAWLNTFGYKRAGFDFSNNFWEKLIHPDDLEEYKEKLQLHLNDKQEYFEADFRILGKKGGYRWVNFKGHWVERNEGKITDMLGITLDIQVKKDQEELVLASNRRKVNETKLVALSSMVSGISHSLKNLLSPVYGYADFGLMTITDNDQLKNELKIIKSSARNANDIIDDMLAFAGVENHSNTRIDLIPIIKKIISDWTDNKKDIKIQFQNKLIHATILGDKRKISQAIGNVLKNSYDASSEGDTIHIEIQYLVVSEENKVFFEEMPFGEYVSIKIKDFGEGIDEQHMDRIFEPFYSTKEIGTGVGLGLAVTKGVINSHKGYILVTSEAYKGTLTHIFLPTI